jgi:hypothetical protein
MMQLNSDNVSSQHKFSWNTAFLCGMASVGGSAFFGTLISNVAVMYWMFQGLSANEAYDALGNGITSPTEVLSYLAKVVFCFYGGYASAKYGNGHPLIQAIAVGVISVLFYFVMMLSPFSYSNGIWDVSLSLVTPIISSLFGGILYVKRG